MADSGVGPSLTSLWLQSWRLKPKRKKLALSLDDLTLDPEPVLLSPHQEAVPGSHISCLQCPGMRGAGSGPKRPHAAQRTGEGICLLHPSTIIAEATRWLSCALATLGFSQILEQQWLVAGA